ncbi:MAG: PorT family protein [Bacteroidetes bacterium]|nr:MAG: PorT family protein [Bacteroidota bacterium]
MKKAILMCLLLTSASCFAQKFQLGIKGGVNISSFTGSNSQYNSSYSALVGWNAGGFVNFLIGDHFAIAPELLYSTAGAKVTVTAQDNTTIINNQKLKLSYLSIPVFAKYRFTGGFFLETGPSVNFNISSSKFLDESVRDITKKAEFAWGVGLGYQSPIGLGIGARYNFGISKVNDNTDVRFSNASFHNSIFMVDLFWTIFNNQK